MINVEARSATWTDFDGDVVTMKWSSKAPVAFSTVDHGHGLLVSAITLDPEVHTGVALSMKVTRGALGDGQVDIGRLVAEGTVVTSLLAPKVSFSEIDAGDGMKAVGTLSIGSLGTAADEFFSGNGSNGVSLLDGTFRSLRIAGNVSGGSLVAGIEFGRSGALFVGGDIRGDTAGSGGSVMISGLSLTTVTVAGNIIGGNEEDGGSLRLGEASVGKIAIGGSIIGGEADFAGLLKFSYAKVLDIGGSVVGGTAAYSGTIDAFRAGTFMMDGSVVGGSGPGGGAIFMNLSTRASIGGSIVGGTAPGSGRLEIEYVPSLTIHGSVFGGTDSASGMVLVDWDAGRFLLKGGIYGHQEITSTHTFGSALVRLNGSSAVTILAGVHAGHVLSGTIPNHAGALILTGDAKTVTIKGGITGNAEMNAFIFATGGTPVGPANRYAIDQLNITGNVSYATIATGSGIGVVGASNPETGFGTITVKGNWLHSNVLVGVNDVGKRGASMDDTRAQQNARLNQVSISGLLLGDPSAPGGSGFEAGWIGKIVVGGETIFRTGDPVRVFGLGDSILVRQV